MSKLTNEELDRKAAEFEVWADGLESTDFERVDDLRAVAEAADAVRVAAARLREAVEIAHARGRSWGRIGIALDVSAMEAERRFGGDA